MERTRIDLARARTDTRASAQERRARTRLLIELGGLVRKAGIDELMEDDRATLLGALFDLADQLTQGRSEAEPRTPDQLKATWRRRGLNAFEAERTSA